MSQAVFNAAGCPLVSIKLSAQCVSVEGSDINEGDQHRAGFSHLA